VTLADAVAAIDAHGFVVLPGLLSHDELAPGRAALTTIYPTAEEFHGGQAPERASSLRGEQFAGIEELPAIGAELGLLAVHPKVVALASAALRSRDIRTYGIEAWAKYTGAVDYEQEHHRDYLGHTLLVPSSAPEQRQLEIFVFLDDVTEDLGPTHVVPRSVTDHLPVLPNWFSRESKGAGDDPEGWHSRAGHPDLYEAEVSAAGPAGTVLAYTTGTFHRATNLTQPGGARFTIHVNYRRAETEWASRHGWAYRAPNRAWHDLVERATPDQLALFGWPSPGDPYWTDETRAGVAQRYPGLDLTPWK
jgi:hypothetical protein